MDEVRLSTKVLLVSAFLMLIILLGSPLAYRFAGLQLMSSLSGLMVAMVGGAIVIVVALFYLPSAVKEALTRDRDLIFGAIAVAALPIVAILPQFLTARSVPPIHDITTDTANPPMFMALHEARVASPNGAEYGGNENWPADKLSEAQRQAYPEVQSIESAMPVADAVAKAAEVLGDMGLEVVSVDPAAGSVEATDTTFWYRFKDDVVVRVTGTASGSRIDVRSMSRMGQSDVGVNAKRIMEFKSRFSN